MHKTIHDHPSPTELVQLLDGEASCRERRRIEKHLESCWQCRPALSQLERTVEDCVHYHGQILPELLPEPPQPWRDLRLQMRRAAEQQHSGLVQRLTRPIRQVVAKPRFWAPSLAALLIAVLLVDHLRNAPAVQAAELLEKAEAASTAWEGSVRRIQIRQGSRSAVRTIGGIGAAPASLQPADSDLNLQTHFDQARYDWKDPLTARSFAAWRQNLIEKQDEVWAVSAEPGRTSAYLIRTTTRTNHLRRATLELSGDQLRPVRAVLDFEGQPEVELSISSSEPAVVKRVAARPAESAPLVSSPAKRESFEPAPAPIGPAAIARATAADELRVYAILRELGADVGAPVEVQRTGQAVVVGGIGVAPELKKRIATAIQDLPRVRSDFDDPEAVPAPEVRRTLTAAAPGSSRALANLQARLGGEVAVEAYAGTLLATSDELMARLYALRRLARRFPPSATGELNDEDRRILDGLLREHGVAAAGLSLAIEEQLKEALPAPSPGSPAPALATEWQPATETLFSQARRVEALLAALFGGAAYSGPQERLIPDLLSEAAILRGQAARYVRNSLE